MRVESASRSFSLTSILGKITEEEVKSEVEWKGCVNSHCLPSGHGCVTVFRKPFFLLTDPMSIYILTRKPHIFLKSLFHFEIVSFLFSFWFL